MPSLKKLGYVSYDFPQLSAFTTIEEGNMLIMRAEWWRQEGVCLYIYNSMRLH
jgi:hypothetical protein